MDCLIGTDIDCEFYNMKDSAVKPHEVTIGKLTGYDNSTNTKYPRCGKVAKFHRVRVRQDNWHVWDRTACPLPKGLQGEYRIIENERLIRKYSSTDLYNADWRLIIAFKVTGLAKGYKYV